MHTGNISLVLFHCILRNANIFIKNFTINSAITLQFGRTTYWQKFCQDKKVSKSGMYFSYQWNLNKRELYVANSQIFENF